MAALCLSDLSVCPSSYPQAHTHALPVPSRRCPLCPARGRSPRAGGGGARSLPSASAAGTSRAARPPPPDSHWPPPGDDAPLIALFTRPSRSTAPTIGGLRMPRPAQAASPAAAVSAGSARGKAAERFASGAVRGCVRRSGGGGNGGCGFWAGAGPAVRGPEQLASGRTRSTSAPRHGWPYGGPPGAPPPSWFKHAVGLLLTPLQTCRSVSSVAACSRDAQHHGDPNPEAYSALL